MNDPYRQLVEEARAIAKRLESAFSLDCDCPCCQPKPTEPTWESDLEAFVANVRRQLQDPGVTPPANPVTEAINTLSGVADTRELSASDIDLIDSMLRWIERKLTSE